MELTTSVPPETWNIVSLNIRKVKVQNIHRDAYQLNWFILTIPSPIMVVKSAHEQDEYSLKWRPGRKSAPIKLVLVFAEAFL